MNSKIKILVVILLHIISMGYISSFLIRESNVILVQGVVEYSGVISKISCEDKKYKNKSYITLEDLKSDKIVFRMSGVLCKDVVVGDLVNKKYTSYFIGGYPLLVEIDSKKLLSFDKQKNEHNDLVKIVISFPILTLIIYIGFLFKKSRKSIGSDSIDKD